ncbi:multicopper oxidase family protein [Azospirillum rugosum]|uniref:FtsP/CotA-like multicopper oxidase with cupredoxin domain n=1 Tax=Azospirillum rugosum TaxID=416170 RepID=A0ABS4SXW7_9PROT|nr:multicopper oxidase family protein [Azospirillum rugosum]MBP2296215.1 FtsP/CotA-like multicopper oxidase with cupredoxin domain [Azospirillum rugosum]MDQ0527100.1 FtsP/CotA-like multicopper oxidase with cupredoxin domain [Azospirillum rugosum]
MLKNWLEKRTISRRSALLGGSAAVAVAVTATGGPAQAQITTGVGHIGHTGGHPGALGTRIRPTPSLDALAAPAAPGAAPTLKATAPAGALPTPPVFKVASGKSTRLGMKPQTAMVGNRQAKNLRTYDNVTARDYVMGPTLEFGQTGSFGVQLVNELPLNPDQAKPHIVNIPSQFNTTNLHTHGLHVSPEGNGDNVYVEVLPKGTAASYANGRTTFVGEFQNVYNLKNHTPGTFWYHPHRHGSVAIQVASGAAGALIVRGGPGTVDAVPGISGIKEQVLLIQQVVLDRNGELPTFDVLWNAPDNAAAWTVNGTIGRTLALRPGEVQRWRIVNTGFQAEAKFALFDAATGAPQTVTLIAMDGVNFSPKAATVQGVYLPPGGRADILVQAPDKATKLKAQVGQYVVQENFTPKSGMTAGFEINGVWQEAPFAGDATTLFTVDVAGEKVAMSLPTDPLPRPLVPDIDKNSTPDGYRTVVFDVNSFNAPPKTPSNGLPSYNPGATPTAFKFQVNGELFCPGRVMFEPKLGTVDQYVVSSPGLHVFHIHVNPFLVTEVDGQPLSTPMWRDTMLAGPNGYKALTKYTAYTGTFPIHCHILDHEDVGMMTNVSVVGGTSRVGPLAQHTGH